MSELIDENGLTFARFVESVVPKCISRDSISFVNPQRTYRVILISSKVKISGKECSQCFDEHYLLPIADELGLNLTKTAKLMALRNAWIAYFQESGISQTLVSETQSLTTNEIAMDYIVLTSAKWSEHPWMGEHPWIHQPEGNYVSLAEAWDHQRWQAWIETQEEDEINSCINDFYNQRLKKVYTSLLEKNADYAEHDIKLAKKRIQELHAEVEMQEKIIKEAMKPIRTFQNYERTLMKRAPGRPKISDMKEQQQRRDIAMKFVAQWISSLMSTQSISSCGGLAKLVGGQKMTWWRWLNKETLPLSSYLESLLDVKIKNDEHISTKLRDIQTTPALIDLIKLVELV